MSRALSPWWSRDEHLRRRPYLLARARLKAAIRAWFEAQGFVEVETACLQLSPGNETHLQAFRTELVGSDRARTPLYLHTSPEFACKKLLAAGEERIFTFAPSFRNGERGALHAPEFTMLEWYRVGAPYETLWADCEAILKLAARETGRHEWSWRGGTCDVSRGHDWTTLDQAFAQFARIPLAETYDAHGCDRAALARQCLAQGMRFAADESWSDLFSRVLVERIDDHLGNFRPEILCEYPIHEAALARPKPDCPRVAERFELFVCGVELANGFGELTDAVAQRARLDEQMALKERIYGERYPIDDDFIAALAHMPASSGCALGFDRLVMLATGARSVADVQWTPVHDPERGR